MRAPTHTHTHTHTPHAHCTLLITVLRHTNHFRLPVPLKTGIKPEISSLDERFSRTQFPLATPALRRNPAVYVRCVRLSKEISKERETSQPPAKPTTHAVARLPSRPNSQTGFGQDQLNPPKKTGVKRAESGDSLAPPAEQSQQPQKQDQIS